MDYTLIIVAIIIIAAAICGHLFILRPILKRRDNFYEEYKARRHPHYGLGVLANELAADNNCDGNDDDCDGPIDNDSKGNGIKYRIVGPDRAFRKLAASAKWVAAASRRINTAFVESAHLVDDYDDCDGGSDKEQINKFYERMEKRGEVHAISTSMSTDHPLLESIMQERSEVCAHHHNDYNDYGDYGDSSGCGG